MKRRRLAYVAAPADAPISALNTTPLIDVMLVLLIMFIVTIPISTHSVKLDLPTPSLTPPAEEPEVHRLVIDSGGRLFWNGAPVSEAALPGRLATLRDETQSGVLHLEAAGEARYEDVDRLLATVKRANIERLGFVGNERFAEAIAR